MVQAGGMASLVGEAGAEGRVVGVLVLEHLDRDLATEDRVAGAPHLAHAAGRDALDALVALAGVGGERGVRRAHFPITASITALAIGAARPLPEISSRATPASCTSTATATAGVSAGAKETNQAYGGRSGALCAVPVLPATSTPGDLRGPAGAVVDDGDHHLGAGRATAEELIAGWSGIGSGSVFSMTSSLGDLISSTR